MSEATGVELLHCELLLWKLSDVSREFTLELFTRTEIVTRFGITPRKLSCQLVDVRLTSSNSPGELVFDSGAAHSDPAQTSILDLFAPAPVTFIVTPGTEGSATQPPLEQPIRHEAPSIVTATEQIERLRALRKLVMI